MIVHEANARTSVRRIERRRLEIASAHRDARSIAFGGKPMTRINLARFASPLFSVRLGGEKRVDSSTPIAVSIADDASTPESASPLAALAALDNQSSVDRAVADALEVFSTRLANVKHAISADVQRATAIARGGAARVDALIASHASVETRLARLERALFGAECANANAADCAPGACVMMRDNAAFETMVCDGDAAPRAAVAPRSPSVAATCAKAMTVAGVRLAFACAVLWFIFWITVVLAVFADDVELTRSIASSAARPLKTLFWDEIFAVMA